MAWTNHDMCTAVALAEDLQIFIIQAMGCGASTAQVAPQDFRAILPGERSEKGCFR